MPSRTDQLERKALERAVAIVGGQTALAKRLRGYQQQHVHNWLTRHRVPHRACPGIERATQGIVRCEQLRRDVTWVRNEIGRPIHYEVSVS